MSSFWDGFEKRAWKDTARSIAGGAAVGGAGGLLFGGGPGRDRGVAAGRTAATFGGAAAGGHLMHRLGIPKAELAGQLLGGYAGYRAAKKVGPKHPKE